MAETLHDEQFENKVKPQLTAGEYPRDRLEQLRMSLSYSMGYSDGLRKAKELSETILKRLT